MGALRLVGTVHLALAPGVGDSPCGLRSMWHRGIAYTRFPDRVTCRHCRRWLAKQPCRDRCPFDGPDGPVYCAKPRHGLEAHEGGGKRWPNLADPKVRASLRREARNRR